MSIVFDPAKDKRNVELRGLSLSLAADFDWAGSHYAVSRAQNNDASTRFVAIGPIGRLIYVIVFTLGETGARIISLRRASRKERARWSTSRTRS